MRERVMQEALAEVIRTSPLWPAGALVVVARPGDITTMILTAVGKAGLCAVVGEPDNLESLDGAATFVQSSEWTVTVFTSAINETGMDNLHAAGLVRRILAETNPEEMWAEPLGRCRIRFAGEQDGIAARDVTFTGAYQGDFE